MGGSSVHNDFVTALAGISGGAVTHRCVLIPESCPAGDSTWPVNVNLF